VTEMTGEMSLCRRTVDASSWIVLAVIHWQQAEGMKEHLRFSPCGYSSLERLILSF